MKKYGKRVVTLLLTLLMVIGATIPAFAVSVTDFTDVKSDDWFYDAVDFAVSNDLFSGTADDKFSPNTPMTRGMFVTVLSRKSKVTKDYQSEMKFTDVPKGEWFSNPVAWAAHFGIVSGETPTRFNHIGSVSREQMATILYRYAEKTKNDTSFTSTNYNKFPDTKFVSDYAVTPMKWATSHGIINGSNGKLDPKGPATRAQVATIFKNANSLLVNTEIDEEEPTPPGPGPGDNIEELKVKACGQTLILGEKIENALKRLPKPAAYLEDLYGSGDCYYFGNDKENVFFIRVVNGKVSTIAAASDDMEMLGFTQKGATSTWDGKFSMKKYKGVNERLAVGSQSMMCFTETKKYLFAADTDNMEGKFVDYYIPGSNFATYTRSYLEKNMKTCLVDACVMCYERDELGITN